MELPAIKDSLKGSLIGLKEPSSEDLVGELIRKINDLLKTLVTAVNSNLPMPSKILASKASERLKNALGEFEKICEGTTYKGPSQ